METKQVKRFSMAMFLVAFALMIAAVFAMPAVVKADSAPKSTSNSLEINYSLADYTIDTDGNYIIIPSSNADTISATTANGTKKKATIDLADPTKPKMYLVGNVSSYNVVYSLSNADGNVATETISINLEQNDASFKFEENSKEIIPSVLQKSENNTIVFPYPFVFVGEESDEAINVNAETQRPTDVVGLTLTLTSPSAKSVAISKNADTGYYEYKVDENTELGKYTLRYTYKTATTQTVIKTYNFTVKDGAVEQEIKIDSFSSSLPSAMALFVETNLPKPVVVNTLKSNAEVSAYSKIYMDFTPTDSADSDKKTIYTNDIDKKGTDGYTYEASLNNYKFTPTVAGKFTVTYSVVDFFGNTAESSSSVNAITASKTRESGSGYIVEAYADFAAEKELVESGNFNTAEYKIPSKVKVINKNAPDIGTEEIWALPAIFGIDKLTTDSSKLTYERIVRYTNSSNNTIKVTFLNSGNDQPANAIYESVGTYKALANEAIPFRFTEATDYTVEYNVKDANGNILFSQTYTVTAENDYADSRNPTVKFEGLSSTTVNAGKMLKFKVTGLDTISETDSSVADSRLNMAVSYAINGGEATQIYADENGYYTYDTKDLEKDDVIVITAVATDDYNNSTDANNTKTITVKKVVGANPPTMTGTFDFDTDNTHDVYWTIAGDELQPVKSGDTVKLPTATFNDANLNSNLSVKITAKVGSNVVYQTTQNSGSATTLTVGNEEFVVSRSGDYVVNYVVLDAAGNKLVRSFVFTVIGPEKAIINLGSFDSNYEYGTEIDLRNLNVTLQTNAGSEDITDDCSLITNIDPNATEADIRARAQTAAAAGQAILVQIIGDYELTDDESMIKAGQNGSVTINYWAVGNWDAAAFATNFTKTPKTVNFTVKDTTKPTIVVDEALIEDVVPYDSSATGKYANMVKIADIQKAYDLSGIEDDSIKITAKYNTATKDLDLIVLNGKFTTEAGDVYYVGNNKVTIGNTEYDYDSEGGTYGTLTSGLDVYNLDAQGKVTIGTVEYTFTEETEYYGYFKANQNGVVTITYTAADKMGNTQTKTFTITVGDVTPPEINVANIKTAVDAAKYQKGNTVSLNLKDNLKVLDDTDTSLTYKDVTVTVTRDGEEVDVNREDEDYAVFEVSEYGTYVVSFNVKDKAGYSADTATVSFTVSNNTPSKTASSTTVWGTVLIVVILVALGVIIFLFAKPSKQKQTVKLTDKKNDKKNDKIEV